MERVSAKEKGQKKLIRDRANSLKEAPPRRAPSKSVIKQAGRYHAIETAKKQLNEARQTVAPDQEQQPYTATDKVESNAINLAQEIVPPPRYQPKEQPGNVSHGETSFRDDQKVKKPSPQDRMRRQAVQEARKEKAEPRQQEARNVSHRETHYSNPQPAKAPTPKERMRRQMIEEIKQERAEASWERIKNLSHGETSVEDELKPDARPKEQLRRSTIRKAEWKQKELSGRENSAPVQRHVKERPQKSTESREAVSGKQRKGQRQKTLPQSSSASAKTELAKKRGRRLAQKEAAQQIKAGGKTVGKAGNVVLQKIGAAVTKAVRPSSDNLILYGGYALVIIVPLIMLAGIAVALFGSGEGRSSYVPVSAEVEAYTPIIQIYANQYGIPEYTELIKAVMMQESGGQGTDPMQASESGYNTRYPHTPNSITDPEYSIDVGVHTLADVLNMASVENPIALDRISLALQGYNFGPGYISWALANYGGYSELNAIEFSDMMAAQYGWAGYGDKAYVSHVLRYYPVGRAFMGEGNTAMVAVAQTQFGNVGGEPYWRWWGLDYRVEWCAIFVSWCADQCGYLDTGVLPKMEGVRPYVDWFIELGQWQGRDYEPMPGDIIFFDWQSDGLADHIGIVEKVEGGFVYTIEGNAGDVCTRCTYEQNSNSVLGYGTPWY